MSKAVLQRIGRLVADQKWVKGAVNYDEDLHFSTYYVRASCSNVTGSLYPGYSCVVGSYDGFKETYYLLKDECRQSAAAIVEKAKHQPQWLQGVISEIQRQSDRLAEIFPPQTSPSLLARLSDARLLAVYSRHDIRNRALYKFARLPEALDRGASYFTEYLMAHLRDHGLGESAAAEAFAILSEPEVPSILAQEILDFDRIVQYVRAHPETLPHTVEGPGRARMLLDPELFRRIELHREKWQYLSYHGYGRRELATLDHYIGRLLEQSRNPAALADCAGLIERGKEAGKQRHCLLNSLKLDRAHAALFEAYPRIGEAKLYRRYAQLRNFYFLDMLMAEIGRRLGVNEWTVRCMLPQEVVASVRKGRLISPKINGRRSGCVFAIVDGQEHVFTGQEAEKIRTLFRPASTLSRRDKTLHGTVACRGKIAGPCRVIIRADDFRGELQKGTIVVSESTDPDMLRFLRAAAGVLTEQGGVTSHAAIICRELGIPTIIGIDGLLERIHDGDWVELDAERGTVTVATNSKSAATMAAAAEIHSPEVIGSKAYNLGIVRSLGFCVPDYLVLAYDHVRRVTGRNGGSTRQGLVQRVIKGLGLTNGDKLVVRSSAISEDRDDSSCAGAFRSLLNVGKEQLVVALTDFVKSNGSSPGRAAYRGSVIVQRMIKADCAGVCLTRDGRIGNGDAVIVEMTAGGNTGVTGGTVRPDRFVVNRLTGDIVQEERRCDVLRGRAIDVTGMVQQFLKLESKFGKPLDIEWALAGENLYILQARPIVNGQSRPENAGPEPATVRVKA